MTITRSCLTGLIVVTLLGGCASLVIGGGGRGADHGARDARDAGEVSTDTGITSAINRQYVNDDLVSALDLRVHTYQGVVTLRGTVPSQAAAIRAVELARNTANVKRVISRITVRP